MENELEIVNRVEKSGLITIDLEDFLDTTTPRKVFDIGEMLFQGLILREKDFRAELKSFDWSQFSGCYVAITCSVDAIIPSWSYMLVGSYLSPIAKEFFGSETENIEESIILKNIDKINPEEYRDKKVIVKGCSTTKISTKPYIAITKKLTGVVSSFMFGEACSTVPIFKRRKK